MKNEFFSLETLTEKQREKLVQKLIILRKEVLHLNQVEFAASIGISQSLLSMIETGAKEITDEVFLSICRTHKIDKQWFLTGDSRTPVSGNTKRTAKKQNQENAISDLIAAYSLNEKDAYFIDWFCNLTAAKRSSLINAIRSITEL